MDIIKELENDEGRRYFISKESIEFIIRLMKLNKVRNVLEIGTAKGYSTILLAKNCERVTSIEKYEEQFNQAEKNVKASNLKNIKLRLGDALTVLEDINKKFDLVFIDADKGEYFEYFKKSWDLVNENGLVIFDNTVSHRKYLTELLEYIKQFDYLDLDIGKGLIVVYKKINLPRME